VAEKNLKPGWKVWRFDQMATNVNVRIDDPSKSGMEHYIGLEHLDPDSLRIRRWGSPSDVEAGKLCFKTGDIIFAKRRAYQRKLGVAEFDGICSAHAMVLRAKPDVVVPEFLPFFMQSDLFMNRAVEISVGSLSPTINWKTMALPPIDDQAQITDSLDSLEQLSYAVESSLLELNNVERAAIQAIIGPEGGWSITTMRSIVTSIEAGKSPKASSLPAEPHEFGVLKVSAVGTSGYCCEENKALINTSDFLTSAVVAAGDFLVTRANAQSQGVARTCIVEMTPSNLMLSDKTWRLIFTPDAPSKRFVLAWTKLPKFRSYIDALCSGTEAKNISQEKFLSAPMVALGVNQRAEVDRVLKQTDASRAALKQRLASAKATKIAFIRQVLGGIL
jgi:restriction endonuclease S subunit